LTFDSLVKQVPTELPYPDGILSIQRAGMEAHVALEGYMRALKRYTDFTLYKVIPEDLANVAKE
jgi:hypothetical protein